MKKFLITIVLIFTVFNLGAEAKKVLEFENLQIYVDTCDTWANRTKVNYWAPCSYMLDWSASIWISRILFQNYIEYKHQKFYLDNVVRTAKTYYIFDYNDGEVLIVDSNTPMIKDLIYAMATGESSTDRFIVEYLMKGKYFTWKIK